MSARSDLIKCVNELAQFVCEELCSSGCTCWTNDAREIRTRIDAYRTEVLSQAAESLRKEIGPPAKDTENKMTWDYVDGFYAAIGHLEEP